MDTLTKHVNGNSHKNVSIQKRKSYLKNTEGTKRQATLQGLVENQKNIKTEKQSFIEETVSMFLKANIPLMSARNQNCQLMKE